jgi:hypothetical protein
MKFSFVTILISIFSIISFHLSAQPSRPDTSIQTAGAKHLFIDVHQLEPGKVRYEAVAEAHKKDLAVQHKYGVNFIKYWVDEDKGLVYCLSSSSDTESIRKTHAEAHGLLPVHIYPVTDGTEATLKNQKKLFLDIHYLGAGKVSAKDVAEAHKKDLAVQQKYGVNFINYWVDEKEGIVMCLSEAKDSTSIIQTHKEAHGLLPAVVMKVKQGE